MKKNTFYKLTLIIIILFSFSCKRPDDVNNEPTIDATLELLTNEITITIDEEFDIRSVIEIKNIDLEHITIKSSNAHISVEDYYIKGKSIGSSIITISYRYFTVDISKQLNVNIVEKELEIVKAEKVELNNETTIKYLDSINLDYTIYPANVTNKDVLITSSDNSIIKVVDNTLVACKVGEALITIKCDEIFVNKLFTVVDITTNISIKEIESLKINESKTLEIEVLPSNSYYKDYTITTDNDCVVIDGLNIIGVKEGIVEIEVALNNNPQIKNSIIVEVQKEDYIAATSYLGNIISSGKTSQLTVYLNGKKNVTSMCTYEVLDNTVASVTEKGLIKGLKEGKTTIIIKYNNVQTTMEIETKYTTLNAEYWLNLITLKKIDINKVILNSKEIEDFNENVKTSNTIQKVYDLRKSSSTISSEIVNSLIDNYISKFKTNSAVNNITKILSSSVNISYGIVTNFASVRSLPTDEFVNTYVKDNLQETGLNVGEGVLIYHTSYDGNWYFVQSENYYGWVKRSNIATTSKDSFDQFLTKKRTERFLLITAERLVIEEKVVKLSATFPLVDDTNDYTILFPKRLSNGTLELVQTKISKDSDVNVGFLEYNLKNIYTIAFKMLNTPYSWGDKDILGRDCSSTQNAVYSCFGFILPRNTSDQLRINSYTTNGLGGKVNDGYLKNNLTYGSLIYTSGHVMMYIGETENGVSYIFHNSGSCKLQSFNSYTGTIIGTLELHK